VEHPWRRHRGRDQPQRSAGSILRRNRDRDPASITRSIHLSVFYDQANITQNAIGEAIDAGFGHIVLGLPAPYPANVAQWVADELIATSV
jgi:hypothetical protein